MIAVWHEFHDLPSTEQRKACWIEVTEIKFDDGDVLRGAVYWSSSAETGCDLPQERVGVA